VATPSNCEAEIVKMHSLEDIKTQARKGTVEAVPLGGTTTARAHGTVVQVEETAIIALYNPTSDSFVWIIGEDFATETEVLRYVHDPKAFTGPATVSEEQALKKFEAWREQQFPHLIAKAAGHDQEYQTLFWIGNQWNILWNGPEGYLRILSMTRNANGDPVRSKFLAEKRKIAEKALFDCADRFMSEFKRLEMTPVPA